MAMTTLTSLAGTIFAEEALVAATVQAAPVKAFAHRFTEAEREPGASITVPVFAVGEAQDFDGDYTKNAGKAEGQKITLEKHLLIARCIPTLISISVRWPSGRVLVQRWAVRWAWAFARRLPT